MAGGEVAGDGVGDMIAVMFWWLTNTGCSSGQADKVAMTGDYALCLKADRFSLQPSVARTSCSGLVLSSVRLVSCQDRGVVAIRRHRRCRDGSAAGPRAQEDYARRRPRADDNPRLARAVGCFVGRVGVVEGLGPVACHRSNRKPPTGADKTAKERGRLNEKKRRSRP
jgi:hypothetical protein